MNKYIKDCTSCSNPCDGKSKGEYIFLNDVGYSEKFEDEIINLATDAMFALELSIDWGAIVDDANKQLNDELDKEELDEESIEP